MMLRVRDADGNIQEILTIKGDDYVLTDADKQEIANIVASMGAAPVAYSDVDLSDYYTKGETDTAIQNAINGIVFPTTDLSSYALKTEIPNVSSYQTEAQVLALIEANMPDSGDGVDY